MSEQFDEVDLTDANLKKEFGMGCLEPGRCCSPNRAMALDPVDWVFQLITDRKRAINCMLMFNMIAAGDCHLQGHTPMLASVDALHVLTA